MGCCWIVLLLSILNVLFANNDFDDNLNGKGRMFSTRRTDCEYEALQTGSSLADSFNAPSQTANISMRVHEKMFAKLIGFSWWQYNGTVEPVDLTLLKAQTDSKWIPIEPHTGSRYEVLNGKWLYMMGDSTTRQVWAIFNTLNHGHAFEHKSLTVMRSCLPQQHRESWNSTNCWKNERTCTGEGYGDNGLFSLDWKHFAYDDYDEWLWGPEGPWIRGFEGRGLRRPDVLSVQTGLHAVYHYINETKVWKADLDKMPLLFEKIRQAVDHPPPPELGEEWEAPTAVIIVTSGALYFPGAEDAIATFNRVAVELAEKFGFTVLDRGEIERRMLVRSLRTSFPVVTTDIHFKFPVPHVVATSYLRLVTCLLKHQSVAANKPAVGLERFP